MEDTERPAKRRRLDDNDDDYWTSDTQQESLLGSATVPTEEEELWIQSTPVFDGAAPNEILNEGEEGYWSDGLQEYDLMDLVEGSVPVLGSQQDVSQAASTSPQITVPCPPAVVASQQSFSQEANPQTNLFDFQVAFKTAGGQDIQAPSEESFLKAQAMLASPPSTQTHPFALQSEQSPTASQCTGAPPIAHARSFKPPSRVHPLSQVQNIASPSTPVRSQKSDGIAASTFSTPSIQPFRPPAGINSTVTPSPQVPNNRSHDSPSVFGTPLPTKSQSNISQQSQLTRTQIDLRMTIMKPSRRLSQRPKFVPPFKNGQRPTQTDLETIQKSIRQRAASQQLKAVEAEAGGVIDPPPPSKPTGQKWKSVFDLTKRGRRIGWEEFGLQPGMSRYALQALDLPDEIIFIDSLNATNVRFEVEHGSTGWGDAFKAFVRMEAVSITEQWVKNHWAMIVWKLASMIKAMPNHFHVWWTFGAVWNQLLYRYEREINRAQRSAIKRIQEQDSPASTPMVLMVSQIFWTTPEPAVDLDGKEVSGAWEPYASGFELTDGWYRISAKIDAVLAYAAKRDKIAVGTKIQMTGCRLEAAREGTDVLEAQDKSQLCVFANSSCLGRWDARLGFTNKTFIATLRSISPEGGPINLLDVTILRIYPLGYKETGEANWDKAPWNEQEEQQRRQAWEKRYLEAVEQAQRDHERKMEGLASIADKCAYLRPRTNLAGVTDFDAENVLEELSVPKVFASLSSLSQAQLREVSEAAHLQIRAMQDQASTLMAERVEELCPRPKISDFRVIRVRDSQASDYGFEAQVTVYGALQYEGEFQVGNRYWLSNASPRGTSWSKSTAKEGEIFLTAGHRSKFIRRETT